jgi:hypothetical protein
MVRVSYVLLSELEWVGCSKMTGIFLSVRIRYSS